MLVIWDHLYVQNGPEGMFPENQATGVSLYRWGEGFKARWKECGMWSWPS